MEFLSFAHRAKESTLLSMLPEFFFGKHLDEDETLLFAVHKHWFLGLKELIWPTVAFVGLWILLINLRDKYVFYTVSALSVALALILALKRKSPLYLSPVMLVLAP